MTQTSIAAAVAATPIPVSELFQGFNCFSGSGAGTAVTGNPHSSSGPNLHSIKVCTDYSSLMEAINISASVSGSMEIDSFSAKMGFIAKLNLTSYSVTIVVYANDITTTVGSDFRLKPALPSDVKLFFRAYGDSFVDTVCQGAEFIGVYVFYCQTSDEQVTVKTSLSGKGVGEEGEFDGSMQSKIQQACSEIETRWSYQDVLIGVSGLSSPQSDQVVNFALNFSTTIRQRPAKYQPAVISWSVAGYETVQGVTGFDPIVHNRELLQGRDGQPGIADTVVALQGVQNQISAMNLVYGTYGYSGDTRLKSRSVEVNQDVQALLAYVRGLNENPVQHSPVPSVNSLNFGTPEPTFTLTTVQPGCGAGQAGTDTDGDPFCDVDNQSILNRQTLTQVKLQACRRIDHIELTYDSANFVSGPVLKRHGSSNDGDGDPGSPLPIGDGQFLATIEGWYCDWVVQLQFTTTDGRQTTAFPPSPNDMNYPFNWTVPSGSVLVGFSGRSSDRLNLLQPMYVTFQPATWKPIPSKGGTLS